MKHLCIAVGIAASFLVSMSSAAADSPNEELAAITRADQEERNKPRDSIDWAATSARDAKRRSEVREILRAGGIKTERDYFNAALVFQHGETADDIRTAYALAMTGVAIDPESKRSRNLAATAWDRLMMKLERPQWYGTQFVKQGDHWVLYGVDETLVTDKDRADWYVRSLAEARALLETLNRK